MRPHEPKKSTIELELLANVMEALEAVVVDSGPPASATDAVLSADQLWIPVEEALPIPLLVVQVWNSAWDAIEVAYYDVESGHWHSNDYGFPYLFGAITHWRIGS